MKRALITVAAALLMTGAAHANPTLPREFQGPWCEAGPEMILVPGRNCMAMNMVTITPTELQFHEEGCTAAYVKPAKNGRYHLTLACANAADNYPIVIEHYWMRLHNSSLYMQRVNSAFSKPAQESKS